MCFALLLAGHLGMTLADLCEQMSGREFDLWRAYHATTPIGQMRGDLNAGIVASTVANLSGKSLKAGVNLRPADFMPGQKEEAPEIDPMAHFGAM